MSEDTFGTVYRVEYRHADDEEWRHYYSNGDKGFALDMYAHHVSNYSKEQCRIVRATISTDLYYYKPVYMEDSDDE